VAVLRSTDAGATFSTITGASHVDEHAMWIDPSNPNRVYLGNDGGFFWSTIGGGSWSKSVDLPITQFYAGAIDPQNALRLLGGTQDNNSIQTTTGAPTAWIAMLGGDGFQCLVDPTNSNITFAESQFCSGGTGPGRSTNGGSSFGSPSGFNPSDRYNWNSPIVMSPTNHNVLLVGSQRVYKSTDNGISYVVVSGDLTTNPPTLLTFGTITTLDISAANANIYYAGTDDGKVWRSTNAGVNWIDISAGLPVRYVTRVTADLTDPNVVYVTLSGFEQDESVARVYRSSNQGGTWSSIAGGLPNVPANDILVDPGDPQTLYLATDIGVYASRNTGGSWFPLGEGMPVQTVFDLSLHAPSRTLVAATHGRSQWKLNLNSLPLAVDPALRGPGLTLSAPAPNPSRGAARFTLELPRASALDVSVYDCAGRRITTLCSGPSSAGRYDLEWSGADVRGRRAGAGIYFVRAATPGAMVTRRVVRLD
jgi:photosystem II stability/assembly factor-like uncharacterized protein